MNRGLSINIQTVNKHGCPSKFVELNNISAKTNFSTVMFVTDDEGCVGKLEIKFISFDEETTNG